MVVLYIHYLVEFYYFILKPDCHINYMQHIVAVEYDAYS